jgi:hypothetical protein
MRSPERVGVDQQKLDAVWNYQTSPLFNWNDTFATPLEDEPLEYGEKHLAAQGWDAGKHLR